MDLPNHLFRLQQDVNQLGVQQQQIVTFLGGNFAKVVQYSLLQTLGDLQNRLAESEHAVALLKQERKNDRTQMERTMVSLQNELRTLASEFRS